MFHRLFCFGILQLLIVSDVQAQDSKPQITISKETTYITSPLRPDGRVDYVEALSQMQRDGVTPENNSVVMFRRALGHRDLKPEIAEEYFRQLGMEVLPKDGNYLIRLDDFVKTLDPSELPESGDKPYDVQRAVDAGFRVAQSRPWRREEFPIIARWIDANEVPLKFILEGSARSKFFDPLLPKDRTFAMAVFPNAQCFREIAYMLNTRAMLRLGEGNTDAAWQDILACRRYAHLVAQGPVSISMFVGAAIEGMTCHSVHQIALHGKLNAESCRTHLAELQSIGRIDESSKKQRTGDQFERLEIIFAILNMDAEKLAKQSRWFFSVNENEEKKLSEFMRQAVDRKLIDWDDVLRKANTYNDRLTTAANLQSRMEQRAEVKRIDTEITQYAEKALEDFRNSTPGETELVTQLVGNLLIPEIFIPRQQLDAAADSCTLRTLLSHCVFALAAWKAEHGSYPDQIDQLAPEVLKSIPIDLFTGQSLIYRRSETGYLLYSVGPNLKDDDGFTLSDASDTNETDDIAIRTPDEDQRIRAIVRKRRGQE